MFAVQGEGGMGSVMEGKHTKVFKVQGGTS